MHPGPPRQRRRERPMNNGSMLLNPNENAIFFSMLGYDCYSLAAGIIQLLRSDPQNPRAWRFQFGGVISLVKDYGKRAYFLRLYDVLQRNFKWEQMLYRNFQAFATACPNLLFFEGDDCVFGLNFSDAREAENFKIHLDKRYQQEQKTHQRRGGMRGGVPGRGASGGYIAGRTGITAAGTTPNVSGQIVLVSSKKKKSKKEKKSKLKKTDISNPTNFQHKAHVGWDANGGFSQEAYDTEFMDNSVRDILKAAGENPDRMTKDEIDFAYRFLNQYQQAPAAPPSQQAAPPPPTRRDKGQRPSARPSSRLLPQPPERPADMPPAPPGTAKPSLSSLPPVSANAPPPPPPPPTAVAAPTPSGGTAASGKGDLLSQIRAGRSLKPVSEEAPKGPPTRDDVMAQIRQGTVLKPVDKAALEERKTAVSNLEDIGGIAGALAKALKEIREKVQDSEESSEEEEENNEDEWASD